MEYIFYCVTERLWVDYKLKVADWFNWKEKRGKKEKQD